MKLRQAFYGAKMNKDLDLRSIAKNEYLHAENVRIITPDGANASTVRFALGNSQLSSFNFGTNAKWMGHEVDYFANTIRWAVKSDTGNYVVEYNVLTDTESIILQDTRAGAANILNFQDGFEMTDIRFINDNDNGRSFMFMTDNFNEPRYFNIARAKTYGLNGFDEADISLIKMPPLNAPSLTLGDTVSQEENNLESKFVAFAYRYKYLDGEFSALSPFSEFAFRAKGFSYDYATSTNNSMFNRYSKVDVAIDTGTSRVVAIDIIFKEAVSNTAWIVERISKDDKGWADNTTQTITFSNNKILQALDSTQLARVYDNVPLKAKGLEIIGNRPIFGNYTENYDIIDGVGSTIYPSLSLGYTSTAGTVGAPYTTVKSIRDYEIAIAYLDGKGRMTTPITSTDNTTFVLNGDADKENKLQVTIDSKAPAWATHYRFFIKQSKTSYDTVAPVVFYRDGVYAWLKIEGSDRNKFEVGDIVYVKSDTSGLRTEVTQTKILDIQDQSRNFLETDPVIIDGTETLQLEGTYFKVKATGFSLSSDAVQIYDDIGGGYRSNSTPNNFSGSQDYIEQPVYYGTIGVDDLSRSGTYTGSVDIRYEIEIMATGAPDTFRWREVDATNGTTGAWNDNAGLGINITGAAQVLSNGVSITFGDTVNHQTDDAWVVSAKSKDVTDSWNGGGSVGGNGRRAIVMYMGKDPVVDESIKGGATITIRYDDSASGSDVADQIPAFEDTFTTTQAYANLEEWFHGDNIISQMTYPNSLDRVCFRRGTFTKFVDGLEQVTNITGNANDEMIMLFLSSANYTGGGKVRVPASINISELDNNIIFETIPIDNNSDIFYELPYTYTISGDNHLGAAGDTNQVFGSVNAVINLDYFNSFGWANGFESYKIGDSFNGKEMILDTKPLSPIDEYKQVTRIASLTYGGVYERTTSYNAVNEFNLSLANYKDMDDAFGSIQKLFSKDTDLYVFQEDKTHRVLYSKDVLFNADGSGNVQQSTNVLGQEIAFAGKYGIGLHPESFAYHGNMIYHVDGDAGALMRLGGDGYTEISNYGFQNYFRTLPTQTLFVGGYDPFDDVYMLNVTSTGTARTLSYSDRVNGFPVFYSYVPEAMLNINNKFYSIKNGQLYQHHVSNVEGGVIINRFYGEEFDAHIETVFNDAPNDIKVFKNINIEGNFAWETSLETNLTSSSIAASEYEEFESEFYAYIRGNAPATYDFSSVSAVQGLGTIVNITGNVITIGAPYINESLAVGDDVIRFSGDDNYTVVGNVVSINYDTNEITLDAVEVGTGFDFVMLAKDGRSESSAMKGYYMKVTLTSATSTVDAELFAINTEVFKSTD
jgi:hypothetical protein